jgi:hypothetical protein
MHRSNIQAFLEKMGYRRIYCDLNLEMRGRLAALLATRIDRWGPSLRLDRLAPGAFRQLEAVTLLERISRECRNAG